MSCSEVSIALGEHDNLRNRGVGGERLGRSLCREARPMTGALGCFCYNPTPFLAELCSDTLNELPKAQGWCQCGACHADQGCRYKCPRLQDEGMMEPGLELESEGVGDVTANAPCEP